VKRLDFCSIAFWAPVGSERRTDEEVSALTETTSEAMIPSATKHFFTNDLLALVGV